MNYSVAYLLLGLVWLLSSLGAGALLALLATRLHSGLSFRKLWIFYSALLAFAVGAILAIGLL